MYNKIYNKRLFYNNNLMTQKNKTIKIINYIINHIIEYKIKYIPIYIIK